MKDTSEIKVRRDALEHRIADSGHTDSAIEHIRYGQLMALGWVLEDTESV